MHLCCTREWNCAETREVAAGRADAAGDAELAAALRTRNVCALRKRCVATCGVRAKQRQTLRCVMQLPCAVPLADN